MHKSFSSLAFCSVLAACGTPQEQCIARETRDLRVVERLIVKAEGNLKRGYAYESVTTSRTVWVPCAPIAAPPPIEGAPAPEPPKPRLCLDDKDETVTRPVAIDLVAERSTLNGLKAKRTDLARAANRSIIACRKAYPE